MLKYDIIKKMKKLRNGEIMKQKIIFKDISFEFSEEELLEVEVETLERCKEKLESVIKKLINNRGDIDERSK